MYKKFLKIDFVFVACCDTAGNAGYNEYVVIDGGGVVILYELGGVDDIIILFKFGGVDKVITLFELKGNDGVLFDAFIIIGVVIGNVVGTVFIFGVDNNSCFNDVTLTMGVLIEFFIVACNKMFLMLIPCFVQQNK